MHSLRILDYCTYIIPFAFWSYLCTRNMKALATTLLIAPKSRPFESTETTLYPPTSHQLSFKVNCLIILKENIWSPVNMHIYKQYLSDKKIYINLRGIQLLKYNDLLLSHQSYHLVRANSSLSVASLNQQEVLNTRQKEFCSL